MSSPGISSEISAKPCKIMISSDDAEFEDGILGRSRSSAYGWEDPVPLPSGPIPYVSHSSFDDPCAVRVILGPEPKSRSHANTPEASRPLIAELEFYLFRKMNYLLAKAEHLRSHVESHGMKMGDRELTGGLLKAAYHIKQRLVVANLRMVVNRARRIDYRSQLPDLVSEGNRALILAVERYDFGRGLKFSTYACRVIDRHLMKFIKRQEIYRRRYVTSNERSVIESIEDRSSPVQYSVHFADRARGVATLLPHLGDRERQILERRFGLNGITRRETLKSIAEELKISIERVRQLQVQALDRLRFLAERTDIDIYQII